MNTIFKIFSLILFLFLAEQSNCQIEFCDYLPDKTTTLYENGTSDSTFFFMDINGDSVDDISFKLSYRYDFKTPYYHADFFVTVNSISGRNQFGANGNEWGPCEIKAFSSGDTICDNINWNWNPSINYTLVHWLEGSIYCNEFSNYRYLAFTDTVNGNCFYGWILLRNYVYISYEQPLKFSFSRLMVKKFAYNKQPNHGLIAGDTITNITPTSIFTLPLISEPTYYPNPTSGKLYMKRTGHEKIEILNMNGNVILETKNYEIDLSKYPPGIYYLRSFNGEKLTTKKIIKK